MEHSYIFEELSFCEESKDNYISQQDKGAIRLLHCVGHMQLLLLLW